MQNKKLQADITTLHGKVRARHHTRKARHDIMPVPQIGSARDAIYEAKAEEEEAVRKEKKIEVDYDILMAENSHLAEEVDK